MNLMTKRDIIKNWLFKAEKDVETAKDLFEGGHYDWSLFIWHLAIEKALKAKILSLGGEIIFTHDLRRLAKETEINFTSKQLNQLDEITTFNLEARYDDYKLSFYKKANKKYAQEWVKVSEQLYKFIVGSI